MIQGARCLARDHATAKIRKARLKEYELLSPMLRARSAYQETTSWLEISEHEITICQPFHTLNSDAKLHLRSKLTGKKQEVELQHSAVILVFAGVMYLPEPLDIPIPTQRLLIEPTNDSGLVVILEYIEVSQTFTPYAHVCNKTGRTFVVVRNCRTVCLPPGASML